MAKNTGEQAQDQAGSGRGSGGRFAAGQSGNAKGRPRKDTVSSPPATPAERAFRFDGWYSLLTGLGTHMRDKRESVRFRIDLVEWHEAEHIWRGDDLAARIIETLPNEMMREGFDLAITDQQVDDDQGPDATAPDGSAGVDPTTPKVKSELGLHRKMVAAATAQLTGKLADLKEEVEHQWEELGLMDAIHEALVYERAYGGAAILIGADDGATDLSQPLVPERVKGINFLTVLEPREIQPIAWYGDPQAKKFGKPALYSLTASSPGASVNGASGAYISRIHESRLVVFEGNRVTRRMAAYNAGWGDSILTRVYRILRDYNLSWSAAGTLVVDFAQAVYKMKGLNDLLQEDGKDVFKNRMIGMEMSASVAKMRLIDSEDHFERITTPLQGFGDLLDRFTQRLAMAASLPLPLLSGTSPGGLNASGASGDQLRMFYDSARSTQKRKVVPVIRRITQLIMQSLGGEPAQWTIEPRPLWQPTLAEQIATRKTQMEIDTGYMDRGVLTAKRVENARFGGKTFSFDTPALAPNDTDYGDDAAAYANAATKAPSGAAVGAPDPDGAIAAPDDRGTPSGPEGGVSIQQQVMNGAQVQAMVELIEKVAQKEIPPATAQVILEISFQLAKEDAARMLAPLEKFEAPKPPPPAPIIGGPPKPGSPTTPPPKPGSPTTPSPPKAGK